MKGTISGCLVGLALLLIPQQGHATSLSVTSDIVGTVGLSDGVGATVIENITLADRGPIVLITQWRFDLAYDPTILTVIPTFITPIPVQEGPFGSGGFFDTTFSSGVIDNTTGRITLVSDAILAPGAGSTFDGVVASIAFTTVSAGRSPLTLSNVFLNSSESGFTVTNGSVCVNSLVVGCDSGGGGGGGGTLPEPSTLLLLGSGLVGLAAWRWKQAA